MAGEKIKKIEEEIGALENQYGSRTFSYDPESDKGYQNYLNLMQESGKKAMEDTVGKASALTGGYANSYAASAGQQVYNDFMKQGAEAQAGFRQLSRDEFDAENQRILNQLNILKEQKKSIWDDAALKAGFGDYSGYVNDLGLYESEDAAKKALSGVDEPTEAQIAYAKEAFKRSETEANNYINSLVGVNTDAIYAAINSDTELQNDTTLKQNRFDAMSNEDKKARFTPAADGGKNWGGGINYNAEYTFQNADGSYTTKTANQWIKELQENWGMTKEKAKKYVQDLQDLFYPEEEE